MQKNNSTALLASVSLFVLVLVGVLSYELYIIADKNQESSRLVAQAEQGADNRAISQSVRLIQKSYEEELATFENLVFGEDDLVPLIERIETMGRGFGLETTITSIDRVGPAISKLKKQENPDLIAGEPENIHLTVEALGTWAETLRFLKALESLPYRVMMEEVLVSLGQDDREWRLRLALSVHSFK